MYLHFPVLAFSILRVDRMMARTYRSWSKT